jgi:dolichyl-phosphate-mannose--protein O-mannosyl transferase
MFIYHYFASIPFLVAAIVLFIRHWTEQNPLRERYVLWYMIGVIALFAFFYPVLSGLPIPSWYGALTKWLPSWMFTY